MSDLRERVPGHALIDELLRQATLERIRLDPSGIAVIDDEARGWLDGVHGERHVADLLSRLGPECTVLHSVPVGTRGADIDHVVISPRGVFTINTKYSPGKRVWSGGRELRVDGFKTPYVFNAMREVKRAEEALTRATGLAIDLATLIVFVAPESLVRRSMAGDGSVDVRVVTDGELLRTVSGPPIYSAEQTERIAAAAARPETWQPRRKPWSKPDHMLREFDALMEALGEQPRHLATTSISPRQRATPGTRPALTAPRASRPSRGGPAPRRTHTRRPTRRRRASLLERLIAALIPPIVGYAILMALLDALRAQ